MAKVRQVIRKSPGGMRLAAILMAVWLFGCMAFQYHPRAIVGQHCPTAPIQQERVAIKCCGKIVGYEVRAPKLGEKAFVQCHCAERKQADSGTWIPPKLEPFFLPEGLELPVNALRPPYVVASAPELEVVRNKPPRVPPPNFS